MNHSKWILQHGYQEKSKNHHASLKYVYVDFRFIVDTVTYILKPLVVAPDRGFSKTDFLQMIPVSWEFNIDYAK